MVLTYIDLRNSVVSIKKNLIWLKLPYSMNDASNIYYVGFLCLCRRNFVLVEGAKEGAAVLVIVLVAFSAGVVLVVDHVSHCCKFI